MSELVLGLIGIVPFVVLFLGLALTKIKSFITGFATLAVSVLLALFVWQAPANAVFWGVAEGFVVALVPIIWVIFAAIFTYLVSVKTGAIEVIKKFLLEITPDQNVQAVIVTFCLGGFLESVAGFGTAVAIPTALLITLGYNPLKATVLSLVANSVPVAFGALGIPVIVLSQITLLDLGMLTRFVVLQLLPFSIFIPLALAVIAHGGFKGIRKSMPDVFAIGIVFTIVQTLVAFFVGPELVAVAGSLVSLAVYIVFRKAGRKNSGAPTDKAKLLSAVSNYIILLALVLAIRLIDFPFLKNPPFVVSIFFGAHPVKIDWLTTPGSLLFLSAMIGGVIQRMRAREFLRSFADTLKKIKWSALTILSIVGLAKVMGYSGIIGSVAVMLSAATGRFYPLLAPVLGAVGTFVTGSDTSSNILLGELQKTTAQNLGISPEWIAASNTAGATAGKMISPQSISVAASTVGITDRENAIMRKTLPYCLGYVLILGVYVFVVSLIIG